MVSYNNSIIDLARNFVNVEEWKGKKEIGIEIEVEARGLPDIMSYWSEVEDGSLRPPQGYRGVEFIFKKPLARDGKHSAKQALNYFEKKLKDAGTSVLKTDRTSVHVHLNFMDNTLRDVYTFAATYFILETILLEYCGASRVGNLFCLRAKDAEYQIQEMRRAIKSDRYDYLRNDNLRYSSMNLVSLFKYGSVELRGMRGTVSAGEIWDWVEILLAIKDFSGKFQTPIDVIRCFSDVGPDEFFKSVFGNLAGRFKAVEDKSFKMYEGVRLVQDIAFCTSWELTKKSELKKGKSKGVVAWNEWQPAPDENVPNFVDNVQQAPRAPRGRGPAALGLTSWQRLTVSNQMIVEIKVDRDANQYRAMGDGLPSADWQNARREYWAALVLTEGSLAVRDDAVGEIWRV